jgi:hypothetical protein
MRAVPQLRAAAGPLNASVSRLTGVLDRCPAAACRSATDNQAWPVSGSAFSSPHGGLMAGRGVDPRDVRDAASARLVVGVPRRFMLRASGVSAPTRQGSCGCAAGASPRRPEGPRRRMPIACTHSALGSLAARRPQRATRHHVPSVSCGTACSAPAAFSGCVPPPRATAANSALQRTRLLPRSQQGSPIVVAVPRSSGCSRAAERVR